MPVKKRAGVGLAILVWLVTIAVSSGEDDPILDFYWNEAARTAAHQDPNVTGRSYVLTARSLYMKIGKRGGVEWTDSLLADYFFSGGSLDSQNVAYGDPGRFKNLDLVSPNVFAGDYIRNFFPNDTGGYLAIGFDTDSAGDPRPTGIVLLDRRDYTPAWLYLYYPEKSSHDRITRSFRFTSVDSLVFPDSVWVVGAKPGIFFPEFYRIESGITNIRVGAASAKASSR